MDPQSYHCLNCFQALQTPAQPHNCGTPVEVNSGEINDASTSLATDATATINELNELFDKVTIQPTEIDNQQGTADGTVTEQAGASTMRYKALDMNEILKWVPEDGEEFVYTTDANGDFMLLIY